jgi:hypothetical protein
MARKPIPSKLKLKVMYDSQYACAICQQRGCHLHHIDENHSNNQEENLIFLCNLHHDEAHTKHQLSQNLSEQALRDAKQKWTAKVKEKRELTATISGQLLIADSEFASMGVTWGYINHNRVAQLANPNLLSPEDKQYFNYCKRRGIVDEKGVLIKPRDAPLSNNYIGNSVYDWFEHGDDLRLHLVYAAFADQISKLVHPIHIEPESWTKSRILELVSPGNFIFLDRAFYFSCVKETRQNQHRRVHTFKRKISLEFFVDTKDMFGTTSMTISFSGHQICAALLQLKSIEENEGGKLILHCTPIALGVGFNKQW